MSCTPLRRRSRNTRRGQPVVGCPHLVGWMVWGVGGGNGLLPSGGVYVKIGIHRRVCAGDGSILRSIHRFLKFWHIAGNSRQRKGSWMLLFRGNSPRGVFCEWSAAKVTENPRIAARNGVFCRFCASRSVLLGTECTVTSGVNTYRNIWRSLSRAWSLW